MKQIWTENKEMYFHGKTDKNNLASALRYQIKRKIKPSFWGREQKCMNSDQINNINILNTAYNMTEIHSILNTSNIYQQTL